MSLLGRSGHAAAVYIILAGLQRGTPLLILPFISHVMTPAEYGAATMLAVSAMLLITIVAAPLESLVFRSAAREDDEAPAQLRLAGLYCYGLMPLLGAVVAACVALLVPSFLGVEGWVWAIELLAVSLQPAMTVFALPSVQARQDLTKFAWLASWSIFLMAASKIALLMLWQLGVLGWVISDLFTAALAAALAMTMVRVPTARWTLDDVRRVLQFAIPLIPHKASLWAIASLSRPAMAMVSSLTQVGFLSLGWNVSSIANLMLSEINRAALPRYSRETFPAPTSETMITVRLQLVLATTIPAAVGSALALVGTWIFPESYWPAFALTGVLLTGQAAYGIYLIPTNYLVQTAGATKPVALASGAGALLIFVSLLAFGPKYGALAAAVAIAVGILLMLVIAGSLTKSMHLDIAWRTWRRSWPEVTLGFLALGCSAAALLFAVDSTSSRILAAVALLLVAVALSMTIRRIRPRE